MISRRSTHGGSHKLLAVLAALLTLSGPGCATVSLLNWKTDKFITADAAHPAIEILAIWQAAEGPGPKGIPVRGFAGQIFFFSQDRETPVAVDGEARIYVFDDHGTPQQQVQPLHQYDFDRASWKAHIQPSKIGPTYGVFIPYPRTDYHQAVCSLRIRFTAPKTRPLYSVSSTIVLPGPPLKPDADPAQAPGSPLEGLAKKLQTQPQRTWQKPTPVAEPAPFNVAQQGTTQFVPGQMPINQMPVSQMPVNQMPNQMATSQVAQGQPADNLGPDQQMARTKFSPAQAAFAEAAAAQMAAVRAAQNQSPQQVADPHQNQLVQNQFSQAQVDQTQMNQTQLVPTQLGPTQLGQAQFAQSQMGTQMPPTQMGAPMGTFTNGRYTSIQTGQAARANSILQTSATTADNVGYANAGVDPTQSGATQPGVAPPSGRIRLQAASPAVTHAYWSSDSAESGNADNSTVSAVQPAQSASHANHPLADQDQ